MCGRFTLSEKDFEQLPMELELAQEALPPIRTRFNVAPTDEHPIVRMKREDRELVLARWGLLNPWSKDAKRAALQINAKAETLEQRGPFREAFAKRRCIVLADGFFEWTGPKENRQPTWFHRPEGGLIYFAGLYDSWQPKPGEWQRTFTIVTTGANAVVAPIHDRMPVILAKADIDDWIGPGVPLERVRALMVPAPVEVLVARAVSQKVNSVKNDSPDVLDAVTTQAALGV